MTAAAVVAKATTRSRLRLLISYLRLKFGYALMRVKLLRYGSDGGPRSPKPPSARESVLGLKA